VNEARGRHESDDADRARHPAFGDFEAAMGQTRDEIRRRVRDESRRIREKSDEINRRSGRNLVFAVLVGLVLGVALIASLVFVKELFVVLGIVMVASASLEVATAMRGAGRHVPRIPVVASAIIVPPVAYLWGAGAMWLAFLAMLVISIGWRVVEVRVLPRVLAARAASGPSPVDADAGAPGSERPAAAPASEAPAERPSLARDVRGIVLILGYVVFLGSFTVLLTAQPHGEFWTLGFITVVVSIDIGAYAFGLNFGKHKMAPRMSPGKTWEGLAGATVVGILVAIAVSVFMLDRPWWFGVILGVLLVLTATAGDLTESMIKRDIGIKDMSSWLPGHGGFFDRLDSILPSGAIAFVLSFWSAGVV